MTGDAEQLRAGRPLRADAGECRAAVEHDVEHVDERLDVVDDRRLAEETVRHRERRLVARLAAEALDRVEDRGLLAADVGAGALADLDVERETLAENVARRGSRGARASASACSRMRVRLRVLAAQVDVAALAARRVGAIVIASIRAKGRPP